MEKLRASSIQNTFLKSRHLTEIRNIANKKHSKSEKVVKEHNMLVIVLHLSNRQFIGGPLIR